MRSLDISDMDVIMQVGIPIYFFTGRDDYTHPFALTEHYFSKINAPGETHRTV